MEGTTRTGPKEEPTPTGLDGQVLNSKIKIDYNKGIYYQILTSNVSWD